MRSRKCFRRTHMLPKVETDVGRRSRERILEGEENDDHSCLAGPNGRH